MKPKNVFWFITDSVRSYNGEGDERFRLNIYNKLPDFFDFNNAYTSAPSTIMSASSMFSGKDSYEIARNFSDWEFSDKITSIQKFLKKKDFNIWTIDNSKRAREMLREFIYPIEKKHFIKNLSHANNWTNSECLEVVENIINKNDIQNTNNLFTVWLDCRGDELLSLKLENIINFLKKNKLYDDSMIIFNSDHGYPDPNLMNPNEIENKRHDLIMTEDNIKVPLLIKLPKKISNPKKIDFRVSLKQLPATILDVLEISKHPYEYSLINIFKSEKYEEIFIRSDNRLQMQVGKITVIVYKNFKLYYYYDTNKYQLYNIKEDKLEYYNLISKKDSDEFINIFKELSEYLIKNNIEIFEKDKEKLDYYYKNNEKKLLNTFNRDKLKEILIFSNFSLNEIINLEKKLLNTFGQSLKIFITSNKKFEIDNYLSFDALLKKEKLFDNLIIYEEKNFFMYSTDLELLTSKLKFKNKIFIDSNLKCYNQFISKWLWPLNKYKRNWHFYKSDPLLIFNDLIKIIFTGINVYFLNKKTENPDMENLKIARDQKLRQKKENITKLKKFYLGAVDITFFLPHLKTFGGTQSQVVKIIDKIINNYQKKILLFGSLEFRNIDSIYTLNSNVKLLNISKHYPKLLDKLILSPVIKLLVVISKLLYLGSLADFFRFLKKILLFTYIIKNSKLNPKAIVSFLPSANLIMCFLKKLKIIKSILIINERNDINFYFLKKTKIHKFAINYLYKYADYIFTNSINTKHYFESINLNSEFVFNLIEPNQISTDKIKLNYETKTILNFSRFEPQKNHIGMIKSLKLIIDKYNLGVIFYGKGSTKEKISSYINSNNLNDKIKLQDFSVNDLNIQKNFNGFCYIIGSHHEGISNSMMDALNLGIPVIIKNNLYEELLKFFDHKEISFLLPYSNNNDLENNIKRLNNFKDYTKISKDGLSFVSSLYNSDKRIDTKILEKLAKVL